MISILGIILILGLCFLLSKNRKNISFRTTISALCVQALLAFFILKTNIGRDFFSFLGDRVIDLIRLADEGGKMVFGQKLYTSDVVFFFKMTSALVFISSLISILYELRILQPILKYSSIVFQKIIRVSAAEILINIGSAFVGMISSALLLKKDLHKLSNSQFFSIMTGGMSTMSIALLAVYANNMGIPSKYLLAANIMGIPSGILISKMLFPPDNKEEYVQALPENEKDENPPNVISACLNGAQEGFKIAMSICAVIIGIVSIMALLNSILGLGNLSLSKIFSFIFYPFAFLSGASLQDSATIAGLFGTKIAINEFVAFSQLSNITNLCASFSEKTLMLSTFLICGFANFGSVAMQISAFSEMLPERKLDFTKMGLFTLFGAILATLLSACWANLFFSF